MTTPIAPHISAFLCQRLPVERRASRHTSDAYAYAFQLLFDFTSKQLGVSPSALQLEQIDATMVLAFLKHLQDDRGNGARTRNARLAAIKAFMRFIEHRVPSALEQIRRVLAIPLQKTDSRIVRHLDPIETKALLDAPDPTTRDGVRDRAMLYLTVTAGLRVSELVALRLDELAFREAYVDVRILGKGRRERVLTLWKAVAQILRAWLSARGNVEAPECFLNARGKPMTRSGFEYILRKHTATASKACPSLLSKRVSPHLLRHTCAMNTLQATNDVRKVALWLGHASPQTTEIYLQADPTDRLETLEAVVPPILRPGKFSPPDKLIELLRGGS